jgi:hypothetical protein
MGTRVDDTIHIKVKVINDLIGAQTLIEPRINVWILIGEPTKHFGDP